MNHRPRHQHSKEMGHQAGFTLIEVMIAIVILALISLMAWRGLDSMDRANTALQLRTENDARLLRALQQIERDISWRTTVELPSPTTTPPTQPLQKNDEGPGQRAMPPVLLPPGMEVRQDHGAACLIELVRAAPAAPGHWQRVQWWLQGSTLYRAAGATAAHYPLPAPQSADRVAVLQGVDRFDIQAWEPGRGWKILPASPQARAPASGLEVTLALAHGEGTPWRYRKVIALY